MKRFLIGAMVVAFLALFATTATYLVSYETCTISWYAYSTEGIGNAMDTYQSGTFEGDNLRRYIANRVERDPNWGRELQAYRMLLIESRKRK